MDDVQHLLVLEDDIVFQTDFVEQVEKFLAQVPTDYDGICLGGQNQGKTTVVAPGVLRVTKVGRTHAYSCRPKYMRALCELWSRIDEQLWAGHKHIDWITDKVQTDHGIYAPDPFLIGQGASPSDIGRRANVEFWRKPDPSAPVILFRGPRGVVEHVPGWHMGYERDRATGIDKGLIEAFDKGVQGAFRKFMNAVQSEAASIDGGVAVVWHPKATVEDCEKAWPKGAVFTIEAQTVEEAQAKWGDVLRSGD